MTPSHPDDLERAGRSAPRGMEAWFPPIILGILNLVLVGALIYFIVVARGMRGRIPVPPWLISMAMVVSAAIATHLLFRAMRAFRAARRALGSRGSPSGEA
jgi:hypothetical protein